MNFRLPRQYQLQLGGFYNTGELIGNAQFAAYGVLNIGLQKRLKNGMQLNLNVSDALNSLKRVGSTSLTNFAVERTFDFSQRTVRLSLNHTFGSQKLKRSKPGNRVLEEKNRVN